MDTKKRKQELEKEFDNLKAQKADLENKINEIDKQLLKTQGAWGEIDRIEKSNKNHPSS